MEAINEMKLLVGRKLCYFHNRVVNIYAEKGYKNIPFEHEKRREMVMDCAKELTSLFETVFLDKCMASHLMDKFYYNSGNVLSFFCDLDNKNMDAKLTKNW